MERGDCRSATDLFRWTKPERESCSVMATVELPVAMAALDPNPTRIRSLVANRRFGGHGVEVDVRASRVEKDGEVGGQYFPRSALPRMEEKCRGEGVMVW